MDLILSNKMLFLKDLYFSNRFSGRSMVETLIVFVNLNWELINTFPGAY